VRSRPLTATPLIQQVEEADCGPACLGILLAHWGTPVAAVQLRAECGVSRDGTTAGDLLRVAAAHRLPGRGLRIRDADPLPALRTLTLPAIIVLRGNHFVVLEAVADSGTVTINDPARGRYGRSSAEFRAEFSGIVLCFAGQPAVSHGRQRRPVMRTCVRWLVPARGRVITTVAAGFALGALTGGAALLVDSGAGPTGIALAALGAAILTHGQRRLTDEAKDLVAGQQKLVVLRKLLTAPASFVSRRSNAALGAQVRFAEMSGVLVTHRVVQLFAGSAFLIPVAAALGFLSWPALVVGVGGSALAAALRFMGHLRSAMARRLVVGELTRRSGLARAAFARIDAVHAEQSAPELFVEFAAIQRDELDARRSAADRARPWTAAAMAVEIVAAGGVFGQVAALVVIAPFLVNARRVLDSSWELPEMIGRTGVLDDLAESVSDPRLVAEAGPRESTLNGSVELTDVDFGYSPRHRVLHGVSARVPSGGRLVVTGGGKSTLLRLLTGALHPSSGEIRLGGHAHNEIPRAVLRDGVGYLAQIPWLFAGTVHDNLTLFDDEITDTKIAQVLDDVCLSDVIARRGGIREARVTPGGRTFSGGERRRLALARALLRDPAILLLDEPGIAWDTRIEHLLQQRGVTTVIATNSPESYVDAQLLVLGPELVRS
jgi:ABC-type bacteriocin/lantibiotic exporter with double-glycine peptidase domain